MIGLLDENPDTRVQLAELLQQNGFQVHSWAALDLVEVERPLLAMIFNLNQSADAAEEVCHRLCARFPSIPLLLLAAPGPSQHLAMDLVHKKLADNVLLKPVRIGQLLDIITNLQERGRYLQHVQRNLPASAVERLANEHLSANLCERTILFTDIRGSTQVLERTQVERFFDNLNRMLSSHAQVVARNSGEVIKFTGDGMMAAFSGGHRLHFALRCALELQRLNNGKAVQADGMQVGIGLADGLVMSGFIGDAVRQQYDLIGRTVHLSARLCHVAKAGQIVLREQDFERAHLPARIVSRLEEVMVKGFETPITCCVIDYHDIGESK